MTINTLFLRKLAVAFIIGFAGSLIQKIVSVGPVSDLNMWKAVWVSALSGAVVAGFRALLVLLPVNVVPSDAEPPVQKTKPAAKPPVQHKAKP